jgi:hypothetical protein
LAFWAIVLASLHQPFLAYETSHRPNRLLQIATDRGLLTKLNGRVARFRVSMYADDAVIFLKPTVADVRNLRDLLVNFGAVTGIQTNLQKTTVSTISCNSVNIDEILSCKLPTSSPSLLPA